MILLLRREWMKNIASILCCNTFNGEITDCFIQIWGKWNKLYQFSATFGFKTCVWIDCAIWIFQHRWFSTAPFRLFSYVWIFKHCLDFPTTMFPFCYVWINRICWFPCYNCSLFMSNERINKAAFLFHSCSKQQHASQLW